MDGKVKSDLLLVIRPKELAALDGLETSNQVWEKLKSMYQSSGPKRKDSLLNNETCTDAHAGA